MEALKTEKGRQAAAERAERLSEQAHRANERSPNGVEGAKLVRQANNERVKAGLIKGKLIGR